MEKNENDIDEELYEMRYGDYAEEDDEDDYADGDLDPAFASWDDFIDYMYH